MDECGIRAAPSKSWNPSPATAALICSTVWNGKGEPPTSIVASRTSTRGLNPPIIPPVLLIRREPLLNPRTQIVARSFGSACILLLIHRLSLRVCPVSWVHDSTKEIVETKIRRARPISGPRKASQRTRRFQKETLCERHGRCLSDVSFWFQSWPLRGGG